ncbi:MAG TPA: AAA family ATPase [Candidatus Avisuccinivibrio pullicola]|nr:AAA family ATPase [Candidatus Avisuccinivibrio pullicola]
MERRGHSCRRNHERKNFTAPARANAEFELLRENGGLYVDKTDLIYALIELDEPVFLSRPRRFGKTTLVSTLHSLFSSGLTALADG